MFSARLLDRWIVDVVKLKQRYRDRCAANPPSAQNERAETDGTGESREREKLRAICVHVAGVVARDLDPRPTVAALSGAGFGTRFERFFVRTNEQNLETSGSVV